jgi:putative ABC transport system ATP-binding protein
MSERTWDHGPRIELVDVRKSYQTEAGTVDVLKGLSLAVGRGEIVALIGPSGSGKSTALHLAAGLEVPTSGQVLLDGASIEGLPDRERTALRRRKIGIVFQTFNLLPRLSVLDNVRLPLRPGRRAAK